MMYFEKIENEFYISKYINRKIGNSSEIWNIIKNNKELLSWAIKPIKDKFGEKDLVNGLAICDNILLDYENVDKDIYKELINLIYSNINIARIVLDGACNGGYSYLLMSLWNTDLKLSSEQKQFAVNEAMNKIGTIKYQKEQDDYSRKLEEIGITDDITDIIDIDGCVNPIGAKTKNEYINYMFSTMSDTQAHGNGEFDIRYCILRNPNWSIEEKQKLIMDFWYDDDEYDECLEHWEWNIINDNVNYKEDIIPQIDKDLLYEYSYEDLLKKYNDKNITDRVWNEIHFCKQMHELRPQQCEIPIKKKELLLTK